MLSRERLNAIREKVNRENSNKNSTSNTLSNVSKNGERITERKKESFKTANSFIIRGKIEDNDVLTKRGERSLNCAQQRYIVIVNNKAHTLFTHRCRSRHCQNCSRIKSFIWQEKMKEIFPDLISKYPNYKYLFITFTVKNPKIHNLKAVLLCMSRAYAKMFQRKAFKKWFVADIRSTEITRGKSGDDEVHPHFHALICVDPNYFQGKNYMNSDAWGQNWGECLEAEFKKEGLEYNKLDYPKGFPRVDIRLAKSADRKTEITNKNIEEFGEQLINYVLKYSVKGSDLLKNGKADSWFWEYDKQVKNIRMIAASGYIKKSLSNLERDKFDYYKEQEKIEKLVADDVNFKADKAVFKKENSYDYYLESKKDRFEYIIEAIEAKAYNYQCYYKRLLADHLEIFNDGINAIADNFRRIKKTKNTDDFERLEAIEQSLVKVQCERIKRLQKICDSLVRVGLYKKLSDFVYVNIHSKDKTVIVKDNIVDILKAVEEKLIYDFKILFSKLEYVKTQEAFDSVADKINEKSALIKSVRNELIAAAAYVYDTDNFEYIDLETNERLEVIATIE